METKHLGATVLFQTLRCSKLDTYQDLLWSLPCRVGRARSRRLEGDAGMTEPPRALMEMELDQEYLSGASFWQWEKVSKIYKD